MRRHLEIVFSAMIQQPAQVTCGTRLYLRCSCKSKKNFFCVPFCVDCFHHFLGNIASIEKNFGSHCQWVPTKPLGWSNRSTDASLRFRQGTDTTSVFCHFSQKLAKTVTLRNVTTSKIGPKRCPSSRSTTRVTLLAVTVRYEALSVLLFWRVSAVSTLSEVKTSKSFSQLRL